jgi:predicted glycoside hydrolase/deacetylase ChbG (UPF0249 family)
MVKQPNAGEAVSLAAAEPRLGLGLHIDLNEWEPVDGIWGWTYARVDMEDPTDVAIEIAEQLDMFVSLVGRQPDHLDSHQHVHLKGPARAESIRLAKKLGVPLRGLDQRVGFCGDFYGQQHQAEPHPEGVTVANLLRLVDAMPDGWTELMCHPGYARDVRSIYRNERELELVALCEPDLPAILRAKQVRLSSFADLASDMPSS